MQSSQILPPSDSRSRSGRVRFILNVVICVSALVVGSVTFGFLASLKQPPKPREKTTTVYSVEVFDVQRADLQEVIWAFGTAEPIRRVMVSAQVSGEVLHVSERLKVGESVQSAGPRTGPATDENASPGPPGDLLVRIDQKAYLQQVALAKQRINEEVSMQGQLDQEETNAREMLAKVDADYQIYKKEYIRIQDLKKKEFATPSELSRVELQLRQYQQQQLLHQHTLKMIPKRREQSDSRLELRETERKIAETNLGHTDVRPPFSGMLTKVMVEKGQYVRVGEPLVQLSDLSKVEVPVPLTLEDHRKLQDLLDHSQYPYAELAVNETAKSMWHGQVVRLAKEADESTRTIMAFIQINNKDQKTPLLPGTFVHARINGPILTNVVAVPRDGIINTGKLLIAREGRVEEREITIDGFLRSMAIVSSGVDDGEQMITTNLDVLDGGDQVRLETHRELELELKDQPTQIVSNEVKASE